MWKLIKRFIYAFAISVLSLQLALLVMMVLGIYFNPSSTSLMRSEFVRLNRSEFVRLNLWEGNATQKTAASTVFIHDWQDYANIALSAKKAVIAAEDDGFLDHDGVDLDAMIQAWERNRKAQQLGQKKIYGGSTITQQLVKNLWLSGERSYIRKAQELVLSYVLELIWSKQRILETYLNLVEFGSGIFGIEAAAQHYYKKSSQYLTDEQAARLAVILPRPRYFEKNIYSHWVNARTRIIQVRMNAVVLTQDKLK